MQLDACIDGHTLTMLLNPSPCRTSPPTTQNEINLGVATCHVTNGNHVAVAAMSNCPYTSELFCTNFYVPLLGLGSLNLITIVYQLTNLRHLLI